MRGLIALNVPPPGSHGDAFVKAEPEPLRAGKPRTERAESAGSAGDRAGWGRGAAETVQGGADGAGSAQLERWGRGESRIGVAERGRKRRAWSTIRNLAAGWAYWSARGGVGDPGGGLRTGCGGDLGTAGRGRGTQEGVLERVGIPPLPPATRARGWAGVRFGRAALGPQAARLAVGGQTDDRGALGGGRRLPPPHPRRRRPRFGWFSRRQQQPPEPEGAV